MDNQSRIDKLILKLKPEELKTPKLVLAELEFKNYADFFDWLAELFKDIKLTYCKESLLSQFIKSCDKESSLNLDSVISGKWHSYKHKEKVNTKINYRSYFNEARSQSLLNCFQSTDAKIMALCSRDEIWISDPETGESKEFKTTEKEEARKYIEELSEKYGLPKPYKYPPSIS